MAYEKNGTHTCPLCPISTVWLRSALTRRHKGQERGPVVRRCVLAHCHSELAVAMRPVTLAGDRLSTPPTYRQS